MLKNSLSPQAYQALLAEKAKRLVQRARAGEWQALVKLRTPHGKQQAFIDSPAKRKVIRAGRRGGKTTGIAILALQAFLAGRRVLYATPSHDQIQTFWWEVTSALESAISSGALYKNETEHVVELRGTKNRIRAKTAWNADMLRGDYGDLLILDEYQLMSEDVWGRVGAPMMLDTNGDAVFIYTPLSLATKTQSKAIDPRHAAKLYQSAQGKAPRWEVFHFTSHDNPHISSEALADIAQDMTALAYEQEILAEDKDEAQGALWTRKTIDDLRVTEYPDLVRVYVGVDPPGGVTTECGIVVAGLGDDGHIYILADYSLLGTPSQWGAQAVQAYHDFAADKMLAEDNFGKDMVISTIRGADNGYDISFGDAHASRGKAVRASPVAAAYERGKVHHVGTFPHLEDELCLWIPDLTAKSPNRLDALVWAVSKLLPKYAPIDTPQMAIYD